MDDNLKDNLSDEQEDNYLDAIAEEEEESSDEKKKKVVTEDSDSESKPPEDDVVDEVVREESDRLLKSDDDALERQFEPPKQKRSPLALLKRAFWFWWEHRLLRYGSLVALFLAFAASVLLPTPRYFILNTAGVRVRASMTVVDSHTGLPLKNIPVSLQGIQKRSDDEGAVDFTDLKLGKSLLVVGKIGYAEYEKDIVLGWGSNPLGLQSLIATGAQYRFILKDWLSMTPVIEAEAVSGEDIAQADEEGKIILTVGELDESTEATISADGYQSVTVVLAEVSEERQIELVPAKKHVFVSNRDGRYDLYKISVDGNNEEMLLAATGQEREIPHVLPHPTDHYVAFISTRDGEVNSGGFIYDGLFIIDVANSQTDRIARSEQVQVIGWVGSKLVYTAVTEGVSAGNPERSRIFSYDISTKEKKQLATSNYFNDVKLVLGTVYYSVSSYAVPQSAAKLFTVNPDGSDLKKLIDLQVWNIVRAAYDVVHFRAVNDSYDTVWLSQTGNGEPQTLDAPPVVQTSRNYVTSPNDTRAVWVDQRDGKGVLLRYSVEDGGEEVVQTTAGLSDPVYWINNREVIYRIATNEETADYIMSLDGGEPHKIADVIGNRSRYFD